MAAAAVTRGGAMAAEGAFNIDAVLTKLLAAKGKATVGVPALTQSEMDWLAGRAREVFMTQPVLLELMAPVKVVGDVHGHYEDLLRIFEHCGYPPQANYLFLGDYVDRGRHSIETIALLFAFKIKYPENFFLLRGNHEEASVNRLYGFYDDCKRRFSIRTWRQINAAFDCLPLAATIDDKIFCVHGGLSPDLTDLKQIAEVKRPLRVPDQGLVCDLVWSDPEPEIVGWGDGSRGVSYSFGPDVVEKFLRRHDFDLVVRAHQVVEEGFEFFAQKQLITLFSAPKYCGEFDNNGAVMSVDADLMCSFQILRPKTDKKRPRFH
eukprot:Hpha_TRINITY_DN11231_c0_g1::TRINITY_DN11231_c0_g1_i1::g.167530::m.167530/K06269/PPP1C; serine/threonine-protein phosphatase PP1 catalytic subunit